MPSASGMHRILSPEGFILCQRKLARSRLNLVGIAALALSHIVDGDNWVESYVQRYGSGVTSGFEPYTGRLYLRD